VDGYDLVALIFAREVSDPLTSLVKQIDKQLEDRAAGRRGRDRHGVFVIFCNDDAGMPNSSLTAQNRIYHSHQGL
jgi:hypothetical protein